MKKVFYSPGPYCNTSTYEVVEMDDNISEAEMSEIGYDMAVYHYESYTDSEDDDIEPEYDYAWYDLDDPFVEGCYT